MATSRRRPSEQEIDEISSNFESDSAITVDSTDCSNDSDDASDHSSSQPESPIYNGIWTTGDFRPKKLTFSSNHSGYTSLVPQQLEGDTPLDFFRLYFDEELVEMIVYQTNLYYSQVGKITISSVKNAFLVRCNKRRVVFVFSNDNVDVVHKKECCWRIIGQLTD